MNRFTSYIPSALILCASIVFALSVSRVGEMLIDSWIFLNGGALPIFSKFVFGMVQTNIFAPITIGIGMTLSVMLFLVGKDGSRNHEHLLLSNFAWYGLIIYMGLIVLGLIIPFTFIGLTID